MPVDQNKGKFEFEVIQDINIIWSDNNHPPTIVDGSPVEDDLGWNQCSEPYRVYADLLDNARRRNDVNSRWRTGDLVTFTLKKDGVTTSYTPLASKFLNELNAYSTRIEWRDVLDTDGVGCYVLESNTTIAGIVQPMIILGTFELMHYEIDDIIQAEGTARMLSVFNDVNTKVGIDFTGSKILDSVRLSGKFGYFNDLTELDNIEYVDTEMQKIKRQNFTEYELRVNLSSFCFVEMLRFHLLCENSCWMSDYNFNSYTYYDDLPVIVKEGFTPEHFDGSRSLKGVCKFEDKIRDEITHFHNNRKTAEDNEAPQLSPLPSTSITTCVSTKTGQTTSYTPNDDGDLEQGRGVDFFTLSSDNLNGYGNNIRWTGTTGTSTIQADGIMIDWENKDLTSVYAWNIVPIGSVNFNADIVAAQLLVFGGISTWFIPNRNQLNTLVNSGLAGCLNWAPLSNTSVRIRTSTTDANNSGNAIALSPSVHSMAAENKLFGSPRAYLPFKIILFTQLGL